jgi:hypothetical protein
MKNCKRNASDRANERKSLSVKSIGSDLHRGARFRLELRNLHPCLAWLMVLTNVRDLRIYRFRTVLAFAGTSHK